MQQHHPRVLGLAASIALVLTQPGAALADDAVGGASTTAPDAAVGPSATSETFAGFRADIGRRKKVTTTLRVPEAQDCVGERGVVAVATQYNHEESKIASVQAFNTCPGTGLDYVRLIVTDAGYFDAQGDVEPGDRIKVTFVERRGDTKVTAENLTQDWVEDLTGPALDAATYEVGVSKMTWNQEWIVFPDFGRLSFKGVTIGGRDLEATDPTKVDCVADGTKSADTGRIRNGTDFAVTYRNP